MNNWYQICPPAVSDQETEDMKQVFGDLEKQTQHSIASSDNRERNEVHPGINVAFWLEAATPQTATEGEGTIAKHSHLAEFRRETSEFKDAKRAEM